MKDNSTRKPLFERLKAALEEGIRQARGELTLRTTLIPARPPSLRAQDIVGLRERLQMSQSVFAGLLNVSAKTVQGWEQGERKPSAAALRLLQVLTVQPSAVCEALGVRPPARKGKAARQRRRTNKGFAK